MDVTDTRENGVKVFTITGTTKTPWKRPLGIHWLDLKKLALTVDKKSGGGTNQFSIKVAAKTNVGPRSNMDVAAVVKEKNGTVSDVYFEMDGPLKLSDIPEINRIPESSKFTLTKLIISEHGIEADSTIGGRATDAFIFTGSGWNIALTQKGFALSELIPPLKNTPFKHIKFPAGAVVFSESGINKPYNQLPKVAQDAMKEIFGGKSSLINIRKGLSLVAKFDPLGTGKMAKIVKGIGVHDNVVVMGAIGGIFGGQPIINLTGILPSVGKTASLPKFLTLSKGEQFEFFLSALESGQDFDFELGIGVGFTAKIKEKTLEFVGKVKVQVMEEGFGIDVVGKMEGTWDKPFDIPGFSLSDVTIELGTQEDGAIKLGFGGTTVIAKDKFTMAADAELLPEAGFAPQAIAFVASIDEVPMFFIEQVALSVMGKAVHFEMPKGILPVFKKVKFAFATPGAEDPDLNITGEGFAMAGQMDWLGHELGSMDVSVGPIKGIYAEAAIDNLNIGPLHLKDNNFSMQAGLTAAPSMSLNSNIDFIGIKENVAVKFDKNGVSFKSDVKFGKDFGMTTDLELTGIDLSATHPDFKNADFFMSGDLKLDIGKFIAGPAKKSIDDAMNELNKVFKKGEADVKAAEKKVDGLTTKINAMRAKVRKERAKAEARVKSAENRVNDLQGDINYDWHRYHKCHGWKKDWCKAKWGLRARFTEGVHWTAEKILHEVEKLIAHFPIDLDPRVALLIGERDTAKGILYVAEKAIEGLDDLDEVVEKIVNKLAGDLKNSVNINKASFSGDLTGVIKHDEPLDLSIDAEFFGAHIKDTFAFKVKNVPYDVEYLGLMGLEALDDLLIKGVVDMTKPLKNKIISVVSRNIEKKLAGVKREIAKFAKDFKKYNSTAASIQARNAAFNKEYIKSQMSKNQSPIDYDPKSQAFSGEFIEVGHSGLCLTNEGGKVSQYGCGKEKKSLQSWTTTPVKTKDVANRGYVYLTQGGACVVPQGVWKTVQKTVGDFNIPVAEFQGTGEINVGGCEKSIEYYWKVLKHGDYWLYMANRATGQCLVFNDSNAVPGKAKANWAPCTGAANQVFRIADSVTPKFFKANMLLRSDSGGKCIGTPLTDGGYSPMVDCKKGARYDYLIDIRGDVRFVNRATGKCLQPEGYKKNDKVFEKTCTQLDFQWWSPIQVPGGWMIRNAQTNWCTESVFWGKTPDIVQNVCKNYGYNVITPVDKAGTGVEWKAVTTAAFPSNKVKFDAAYTQKEREPAYTLKIYKQEQIKLAKLRANARWQATHKERQCNATANYWLAYWRERLKIGGWYADVIRAKARTEIATILAGPWCKIKVNPRAKKAIAKNDYQMKTITKRLAKPVPLPPPEPKWYVCRAFDKKYAAWIPGVVDNRKCVYGQPDGKSVKTSTTYDVVFDAPGVLWTHNTGGHVPEYGIPTGNITKPADFTLYSCRTMVNVKTYIGWTDDGKTCRYNRLGFRKSTNFEVLSRDPETVKKLQLGD
ncbi:MAG: DM9 repeat-containing protein [Alphaproteobacteria bacterium]